MINYRYKIIKKIGQGRSKVFLCEDVEFPDSNIAIKILPPEAGEEERKGFSREFFTLQNLDHPNIIKALEIGTVVNSDEEEAEAGSLFLTLEYFHSTELINSLFVKDEKNLKEIITQICSVLFYLHQSKYIYYDLKPENILISSGDGIPQVKIIDLGLAEYSPNRIEYEIKGTAQYIAPELLRKEVHTNSVDLYSLGMILYRIVYEKFPFEFTNELEIYKAQLENEFTFPSSDIYSEHLIHVIKKLLAKDPAERYSNSLQVLEDLEINLDDKIVKDFVPARVYSGRDDALKILSTYINDKSGSEVFTVKGFGGIGKSNLLRSIHELYGESILLADIKSKSGVDLVKYIIRKIVFSPVVYGSLNEHEKQSAFELISNRSDKAITELHSFFITLSSKCRFIILIDDFNSFDDLTAEIFRQVIPVMQINNIKVIISESSEQPFHSDYLNNAQEIVLSPFTDTQLTDFLDDSFTEQYPKAELQDLILTYSDLIPGNIVAFIRDLILLDVMKFTGEGIIFSGDKEKLAGVKKAHFAVFDLRLNKLNEKEKEAAAFISAFDVIIDLKILSLLLNTPPDNTNKIIEKLQLNNILQRFTSGSSLVFTSDGLKKHIYTSIKNKLQFHLHIAETVSKNLETFNRSESARHYELAEKYDASYDLLQQELMEVEKHSAYSYMKKILEHLLTLPLNNEKINNTKIKLSEICFKMSDYQSVLNTINTLDENLLSNESATDIKIMKCSSLFNIGEIDSGRAIIEELLDVLDDDLKKQTIMTELAYADFEQNKFQEAAERCDSILGQKNLPPELKGRCYNLKGMYYIYQHNNMNDALQEFSNAMKYYEEAGMPRRVAGMEVNIGNIFNILGEYKNAEEHWKVASEINQSIGNLIQEGMLLQNTGIFYFERQKFDLAVESYQKALKIFLSTGNEVSRGRVLWNLGEVYMTICEYQNAFNSLIEARKLFSRIKNFEELSDVLFMLGKFYFKIGAYDKLEETYYEFKTNYSERNLSDKYKIYEEYLDQLLLYSKKLMVSDDTLKSIKEEFAARDENQNFQDAAFLLVQYFLQKLDYEAALVEINNQKLLDLCSQNHILEAERQYFLGKISMSYASDKISPALDYFEKAYEILSDDYLSEITWKTMLSISELYINRGNFNKARRYTVYTREMIHFIAENIESPRLRAAYIKQEERLKALQKLESFQLT